MNRFLSQYAARIQKAWPDAAAAAVAAGIAWTLAAWLFGHPHPVFAAVTAIVCLAPGLPSHGKQAIGLVIGVATGIAVGELALLLPEGMVVRDGLPLLRLSLATFVSMLIAASFGMAAVVPIQAGVSVLLVLALGAASAGMARMEDVLIGAIVGLTFSQVVMTPDPVRQINAAADELLARLSTAFLQAAEALSRKDAHLGEAALRGVFQAHDSLSALVAGIDSARYNARWSLRGRLAGTSVAGTAALYEQRAIRLYASSLLFVEAFSRALLRDADGGPQEWVGLLGAIGERCARLGRAEAADGPIQTIDISPQGAEALSRPWHDAAIPLQSVLDALSSLEHQERPAPAAVLPV